MDRFGGLTGMGMHCIIMTQTGNETVAILALATPFFLLPQRKVLME